MEFAQFAAPSHQSGAGLKDYWRTRLKPAMKKAGKHALRLGARVAQDVLTSKATPKSSLMKRARQTLSEIQSGKGVKKRRRKAAKPRNKKKVGKKGVKKRKKTVFD